MTRHAGTPIAAARRMIAASSSSGTRAGARAAPVLRGRSAVDTVGLIARPNPHTDASLDAGPRTTDARRRRNGPGFAVGGAHLAMCLELGAGERCATAQRANLRLTEPIDPVRPAAHGSRGFGRGGVLGYVGDCRSLARHDGPFPCGRQPPKSPQLVPALGPQQADEHPTYQRCAANPRAGAGCRQRVLEREALRSRFPDLPGVRSKPTKCSLFACRGRSAARVARSTGDVGVLAGRRQRPTDWDNWRVSCVRSDLPGDRAGRTAAVRPAAQLRVAAAARGRLGDVRGAPAWPRRSPDAEHVRPRHRRAGRFATNPCRGRDSGRPYWLVCRRCVTSGNACLAWKRP